MRRSRGSLLELEADLRRAELQEAGRVHDHPACPPVRPAAHTRSWRIAAGRRLMRLGARRAAIEAAEHTRALRHPRPDLTA